MDYRRKWELQRRFLRFERWWGKPRAEDDPRGRLFTSLDLTAFSYPYVRVHGEGKDYAYIAVGYGHPGSDPAVHVEVDLQGTRAGRWVAWLGWKRRSAVWWLAHRHDAPEAPAEAASSSDDPGGTAEPQRPA